MRHVSGKTFGPDGLSRRDKQKGDEEFPEDEDSGKINEPPKMMIEEGAEIPLELEDFKNEIDNRKGYLQDLAKSVRCFSKELEMAQYQSGIEKKFIEENHNDRKNIVQFINQ